MYDLFSDIDLSDKPTSIESNESPSTIRARRKKFSLTQKYLSNSPSSTNPVNSTSFHELTPPPPLPLLDTNNSLSSSFSISSNSSRYPLSTSSPSPPPSSDSSSLSPKNLLRSAGSIDLTKRTFNFPPSRQDSIFDSLLSAIYERDGSVYGLSSSQDSDTVTTGDLTDRSHTRRLSEDSILNHEDTTFSKSNLSHKSKVSFQSNHLHYHE